MFDTSFTNNYPALTRLLLNNQEANFGRGRDRTKRKQRNRTVSLVSRLAGPNRAKYTNPERNKRLAMKAYRKGSPGLLERMGVIPNRRG